MSQSTQNPSKSGFEAVKDKLNNTRHVETFNPYDGKGSHPTTDGEITMQQFAEQTFCMKSDSDRVSGEHVLDLSTARGNISKRDDLLAYNAI